MTIELALPEHALSLQPRYNVDTRFMVAESRPNRWSNVNGIKVFDGGATPEIVFDTDPRTHRNHLMYSARVWRADETIEAALLLKEQRRVVVDGSPQSGKGTILYGVSSLFDLQGTGYIMIDGHWQDTPADRVVDEINAANAQGKAIFYDSFDYCFAGSSRVRRISKAAQSERTGKIVTALDASSVPLVLTQHDEHHRDVTLDAALVRTHQGFLSSLAVYELPRGVEAPEARFLFYVDHGLTVDQARSLVGLPDNTNVQQTLANRVGSGDYIDEFALALRDFGTMKELVRDRRDEVLASLEGIRQGDQNAVNTIIEIAFGSHFKMDFMTDLRMKK